MQRAKFDADNQDLRFGGRAHDMMGELQCVDRRIAAHEADDGALDGGIEPAAPINSRSMPGAERPVQESTIRWVISAESPRPSRSTASGQAALDS